MMVVKMINMTPIIMMIMVLTTTIMKIIAMGMVRDGDADDINGDVYHSVVCNDEQTLL